MDNILLFLTIYVRKSKSYNEMSQLVLFIIRNGFLVIILCLKNTPSLTHAILTFVRDGYDCLFEARWLLIHR